MQRRLHRWFYALSVGLACLTAAATAAQERLSFVCVALDVETRQADKKLQEYLYQKAGVSFAPEELEYERVVDRLTHWRDEDGAYVARVTPYVYVLAEMLGAEFEPLATYLSPTTHARTYHAYFVVNRKDFAAQPSLADVVRLLGERKDRAKFIYHSQFSTSSFFLPSLYFRRNRIYEMPESTESLIAIATERIPENSSSKLVEHVARGEADLAAVWDGSKTKFDSEHGGALYEEFGKKVYFVQLPTTLPNDLLLCSSSLDQAAKARLREAIRKMKQDEIDIGDFLCWQVITEATDARQALADLRWLARERIPPVTVEIRLRTSNPDASSPSQLTDAARQAVRLAGTEFVLFDQDFHEHIDFTWTIEPIHDGAVVLHSSIPGSDIEDQVFRISFRDAEDLTRRLVSIVQSRLHRIRYVWSLSTGAPIVIRDMAFSLPPGSHVKVQKIAWLDPEKNKFRAGPVFNASIRSTGYYKYELDPEDFVQHGESLVGLDSMSNTAYRVILLRSARERLVFRVLTGVFLGLLVLAAIGLVWDLARTPNGGEVEEQL
ncbi:MAG: PhnD/SsuA/transferrin family substrate-binding protein [Acidobacteriota bacterium]